MIYKICLWVCAGSISVIPWLTTNSQKYIIFSKEFSAQVPCFSYSSKKQQTKPYLLCLIFVSPSNRQFRRFDKYVQPASPPTLDSVVDMFVLRQKLVARMGREFMFSHACIINGLHVMHVSHNLSSSSRTPQHVCVCVCFVRVTVVVQRMQLIQTWSLWFNLNKLIPWV